MVDAGLLNEQSSRLPRRILITGVAGFIGGHLGERLLRTATESQLNIEDSDNESFCLVGLDNLNGYYDRTLKMRTVKILTDLSAPLSRDLSAAATLLTDIDQTLNPFTPGKIKERQHLESKPAFEFHAIDLTCMSQVESLFMAQRRPFECIIHLAAQAGVRYSMQHPIETIQNNVVGTTVLLDCAARFCPNAHLIIASSSSVYGDSRVMPMGTTGAATDGDHGGMSLLFDEKTMACNRPHSVYAASKKSVEMLSQAYCSLYGLRITIFRFFTVYGPRGRPDMAVYKAIDALVNRREFTVYGDGTAIREFTYIDDIIDGLVSSIDRGFKGTSRTSTSSSFTTSNKSNKKSLTLHESDGDAHNIESQNNEDETSKDEYSTCTRRSNYSTDNSSTTDESTPLSRANDVEVFNIGGGERYTVMELIRRIDAVLGGGQAQLSFQPQEAGDVCFTGASQDHVKTELGFTPKITLAEGIRRTVAWYHENAIHQGQHENAIHQEQQKT